MPNSQPIKALLFRILLLLSVVAPSVAGGSAPLSASMHKWLFLPSIGLEGQAYIVGNNAERLEIECGNGGGLYVVVSALRLDSHITGLMPEQAVLNMVIDDHIYSERYTCVNDRRACGSFGFPSPEVITAMRHGNHLTIQYEGYTLSKFTLAGSNAALSRLASCF